MRHLAPGRLVECVQVGLGHRREDYTALRNRDPTGMAVCPQPIGKRHVPLEVPQLLRRTCTNQPVDEDCRHIGSTLDITAEFCLWLGCRRLFTVESVPFLLDRACDRRTPVRWQALGILVAFPAVRLVERVHFLFRAFAEPIQRQLAPIGEGELQLKRSHLCDGAVFGAPHLRKLRSTIASALVRASTTEQSPFGQRQRNSGMLTLLTVPANTDVKILHPMAHRSSQKQQR